ncbi:PepSY domain-containing protein [Methylobacterium sp. Leaf93]|uniref:PepSY domain-containing protein n=1 Tax=Methylobacterium sp. Leaf93 TaxID=1736249 RepID=UPI0006FBED6D|nr:PepSY domain-containing protein [Methylobacterium sp. Leaf93]KQP01045.1 peptidase [Methylobacterium sp. Leaf93]
MVSLLKRGKRWLVLGHRWLGIATGLLFALWIGSGLVMLYVPFPSLTEAERLARLRPMAWDAVAVSPDEALAAAGLHGMPRSLDLEMRGDEPVYRMPASDGRRITLSARTGTPAGPVDAGAARRLAGAGPGAFVEEVERDQWTVTARYDSLRPFHKVALNDAAGTELYVSERTGEIVLDTTRFERGWNWVGAVTHWVYLTPLRARAELWRDVVLWISGIAAFTAFSGLVLGIWRLRLRRRYAGGRVTPYRGMARWHHLVGLIGGIGLTTFIVSGWLSMNPNRWFTSLAPPADLRAAYAGADSPVGLDTASLRAMAADAPLGLHLARIGGRWVAMGLDRAGARVIGDAPDAPRIAAAASHAMAGARLEGVERLASHDLYWSSLTSGTLPILRLRFADPAATWLHIDLQSGEILNRLDRSGRVSRWLFTALHRLDLPVLVDHPPARDAAQWLLNLLGGILVITGLVIGWRRIGPKAGAHSPLPARGERAATSSSSARQGGSRG